MDQEIQTAFGKLEQSNTRIFSLLASIQIDMREKMVTKDELREAKSELLDHVDGFIKLHTTLDTELVALRSKVDRLEGRLVMVETKLGLAVAM